MFKWKILLKAQILLWKCLRAKPYESIWFGARAFFQKFTLRCRNRKLRSRCGKRLTNEDPDGNHYNNNQNRPPRCQFQAPRDIKRTTPDRKKLCWRLGINILSYKLIAWKQARRLETGTAQSLLLTITYFKSWRALTAMRVMFCFLTIGQTWSNIVNICEAMMLKSFEQC